MVSVSPWLGDRLIFFRSVRESAFVGVVLTATFTFNAAKVAPFRKPCATLIFISADGFGFAQQGRKPCHQHLREWIFHRAIRQRHRG